MALGMQATKRRIRSVTATRKITKAMELVATAKLKKTKDRLATVKGYTDEVMDLVANIVTRAKDAESPYLQPSDPIKGTLYLVVTSSLGLCGGYNSNLLKYFMTRGYRPEQDQLIVIGSKGASFFRARSVPVTAVYPEDMTGREWEQARAVAKQALGAYVNGSVGRVSLVYTRFVNSVTFQPVSVDLLPVDKEQFHIEEKKGKEFLDTLFEPSAVSILDSLMPMYFDSTIYGRLVESHVSEQAARRTAMESASDNADELKEKLQLLYNKARQTAITQEISEVVSGANAL